MKILVAEDDDANWYFVEHILTPYGTCDRALNGQEAVEFFETALAIAEPYDLICMDIMMPVMDGQEALRRIRERETALGIPPEREVVVFITTALYGRQDRAEAFSRSGCTDYLIKPLKPEDLQEKMAYYFDLSQPREAKGAEKRIFSRPLFCVRAHLFASEGGRIDGITQDVSFNSILFLPTGSPRSLAAGTHCVIQVSLDEESAVEECFVTFPCEVVRSDKNGIALRMVETLPEEVLPKTVPQERSRVVVRRSDGQFDAGWEILRHDDRLPSHVVEQIVRLAMKKADQGPVAVCYKKSENSGEYLYKVLNVQYLKELQKMAKFSG